VLQQSGFEALVLQGLGGANDARQQANDGVEQYHSSQFAA
jgi:hypothetical protein